MRAPLQSLLDPAVNPQGLLLGATVLVVGGGAGADLPHWRSLKPQRLAIWEPQAALADELQRKLRAEAGETLVRAAVAPTEGRTTLQVLNNPRESGASLPTGLLVHQPRLQLQASQEVPAQSLGQIVDQLDLRLDAPHLLVLDAPGQAGAILQASLDVLPRFAWLVLRTGTEPLYQGDLPGADLIALLHDAGFDLMVEDADTLPPHRELLLQRNPSRVQLLQLGQRLEAALAELAQGRVQIEALTAAMAEAEKTAGKRKVQVEELFAAKVEAEKIAGKRATQIEALSEAKAELEKAAAKRAAQTEAMVQAQAQADQIAGEREAKSLQKIEALTSENAEQRKGREEQTKLAAERQSQIEALAQEKADLAAARDLEAKAKNAALSQRDAEATAKNQAQAQREAEAKAKAEMATQRDALSAERTQLVSARDLLAKDRASLSQQLKTMAKASEDLSEKLKVAEAGNQELAHRQQLMNDELVKAEAQIELIKDLLLREPGL